MAKYIIEHRRSVYGSKYGDLLATYDSFAASFAAALAEATAEIAPIPNAEYLRFIPAGG